MQMSQQMEKALLLILIFIDQLIMVLLKLDIPKKISRNFKKKLIDIRDEMSYSNEELEEKIRKEARSRRNG